MWLSIAEVEKWPTAVTGDRGQSLEKIFRFNTRRGIASVFPHLSGGGGIRTHGPVAGPTVFKTAPFDRSGTPPWRGV